MEKTAEMRKELQCHIHPLNALGTYKYVVVCSRYEGKWLLSRHRKRETWETQGGHIEAGETPMEAARRELFEESGVKDADIYPVCDYYGYDPRSHSNGMVFFAEVHHLGRMPESEIQEIRLFDVLPENLTYPNVTPRLFAEAERLRVSGILAQMGYAGAEAEPFRNAEDGSNYEVWKVVLDGKVCVLKKAKSRELAVYETFFREAVPGAPRLLKTAGDYFLMEYAAGEDLCRCTREKLTKALDALIALQDRYWAYEEAQTFMDSLPGRENRGRYLKDPELEGAYAGYLSLYRSLPRTLCHDDLLPFNVLIAEEGATIIDWETAGILPYPTSLARLIAHGAEEEDAFFYLKEADRAFAIDYYYENLVKNKGITYEDYRHALDYFLLYEYCEWIMLGNRYPDADMGRYRQYLAKAREHLRAMKQEDADVVSFKTN